VAKRRCEPFGVPAYIEAFPAVTVTFHPATFWAAAYTSCETVYPYRVRVGSASAGQTAA
jgi:hypothetical protein